MSAILPPSERIWWKTPVGKEEIVWITLSLIWCLIMFAMMPIWHLYGKQNLSNEAYRTTPSQFQAKVQDMVDKHTVRTETAMNIPVVRPPAGSDVYLLGRLWQWWPILELEKDKSYRLHISSMDWQHGFSLQPLNINLQILPEYEMVVTITPDTAEDQTIVCNEYCGINHHTMLGKIYVKE
jgi:cytochrome c oxidase subunit 2